MNCTRCLQYPCRCTGSVDVVADHTARMLAGAKAHMTNIPSCNTPWPEAPHRHDRVGGLSRCPDTTDGYHVTEAGDNVCLLCFNKLGGTSIRVPIPVPSVMARASQMVSVPAGKADLDGDGLPVGYATPVEEPWSL